MRIALVSRDLYPYEGGGIAPIVAAAARWLAPVAEVVVFTRGGHHSQHAELLAAGDDRLLGEHATLVFVDEPEPDELDAFYSFPHAYSARVHTALREHYGDAAPDVIEFCDYLGEGFVTVQARHTHDPWLDHTLVCVRLHTTSEICAVLDGHLPDDAATVATHDAERYCLQHADRLLWSGGDVLESYRRFYGAHLLAEPVLLRDAFLAEPQHDRPTVPAPGGPLRLLYLGRAERRKGVQNLLRAMARVEAPDVRLTLLGGDTNTGPLRSSLRTQLELMAAGDDRIEFLEGVPRVDVGEQIARADAVVVPSLWECWPNVVREAFMHNRPVLGTPVGGIAEMVVPGESGWLARDTTVEALADALRALAAAPEAPRRLAEAAGPRLAYERLTDPEEFVWGYKALARPEPEPQTGPPPLVSVVVPYFRLESYVEEAVRSALGQTHPAIEVLVVVDGSLRDQDRVVYELAERLPITVLTQPNAGLGAARNFGVSQARGPYVLPLDADNVIAPTFVERCVHALERDPSLAYVSTWSVFMTPAGEPLEGGGYMPLGNWSRLIDNTNVGGDGTAVVRRQVFERGFRYSHDLVSYEDWLLYRELHGAGLHGAVVPERLLHYRVRPGSMLQTDGVPREQMIAGEMTAHLREGAMRWTATAH